jgi:hypothetical protein
MKNADMLLTAGLWICSLGAAARAGGVPQLQFDQTLFDFGKTSQVASVSGVFKYKNTGDGVLKLEPPKPSCGCTVAELKPDTLPPGATGELSFTVNLGQYRATLEKHIAVRSNDPKTPEVSLTIKADYIPLYDLNPVTLSPNLPFEVDEAAQFTTITRTDGKPLHITKLVSSKPWITGTFDPISKGDDSTARIRVAIERHGRPRRFNEFVQVFTAESTNSPVSTVYIYGQIVGEVSFSPEALYWSITDAAKAPGETLEAANTRRVTIRSSKGNKLELKNPQTTVKGIKVELVPKEPGNIYELVVKLDGVPPSTLSGNVSFETSVVEQPLIEVPVVVNVFKP